MKTASVALQNFLNGIVAAGQGEFLFADLYTFTLNDGSVWRYNTFDRDLVVGANTYKHFDGMNGAPGIKRSKIKESIGLEVTEVTIDIVAPPTAQVSNATQILAALSAGMFDGAMVSIDRLYMPVFHPPAAPDTSMGTVNRFIGTIADVKGAGRSQAHITVRGLTEKLNVQFPIRVYSPGCQHTLFDAGCGILATSFDATSTVASGSDRQTIKSGLTQAGPPIPPAVPVLSYTTPSSGVNLIAYTYYVVITYVTANGESTYSPEASIDVPANSILHVASPSSSSGVIGWNVYVGLSPGGEWRQNASTISIATAYVEPVTGIHSGAAPPPLPTGGYFTKGVVTFTSGPNNGASRYVDQYFGGGSFIVVPMWDFAPVIGDHFSIVAGCDKTKATCKGKFNNLIHFAGQPFIPDPIETI